jgi:hypothetical protein
MPPPDADSSHTRGLLDQVRAGRDAAVDVLLARLRLRNFLIDGGFSEAQL